MKKLPALLAVSLFAFSFPVSAGSFRAGIVARSMDDSIVSVPRLVRLDWSKRADYEANLLHTFKPADRKRVSILVSVPEVTDAKSVDQVVTEVLSWSSQYGPLEAIGIELPSASVDVLAYAIKSMSVQAQGRNIADRTIAVAVSVEQLKSVTDAGSASYVDTYLVEGDRKAIIEWIVSNDPSKEIALTEEAMSANPLFDAASGFRAGASTVYLAHPDGPTIDALAAFNAQLTGDWAVDSTATPSFLDAAGAATTVANVVMVRGEDLRTIVIPEGNIDAARILSMGSADYEKPVLISATGTTPSSDSAVRGQSLLVGIAKGKRPAAIVLSRRALPPDMTKETIDVATARGLSVEEIIRKHQSYFSFQESILPRYIARNETDLRFNVAAGEALEATIAGDHFFEPKGRNDWVWTDFLVNGVRWRYGKIPELPLVQPEKVTQLPLAIQFDDDYRYELARETELRGYDTYEVRFEPKSRMESTRPRFRGTVWIEKRSWARLRIQMVAVNLKGEVLSSEERVDYTPFGAASKLTLTQTEALAADPREMLWIPTNIEAEQVLSTAGRATVIVRSTNFSDFRMGDEEFERHHAEAEFSQSRIVRDTVAGLRYMERKDDGSRIVKEGFDTSRLFLLGGIYHDDGLEFPVVPLGGINYFNFNLGGRGLQTNVFFAGLLVAANLTDPTFLGTRANFGADFFGIAIASENKVRRNDLEMLDETVKSLPTNFYLRTGHPFAEFGKVDVSLGLSHVSYQRAEDTGSSFVVPSNTFVINPGIEARYDRHGWTLAASIDHGIRSNWEPWGIISEYTEEQKNYTRFGATLGKSFYLPKFQRLGFEMNYVDGRNLDRFSKYEFSFFGGQRIRGIESGSLRAEKALIGHLSYGLVFSDQFRLETFYDYGLVTDMVAGYKDEPFQGIGIAGQTVGPFGTLLRMDLGKSLGTNGQDGFVANVVLLKILD